jgi:hypothetical protein
VNLPDDITIEIPGLTELDRLELGKAIGSEHVKWEELDTPPGHFGELTTITAIVTISVATVQMVGSALAIWLVHSRRSKIFKSEVEVTAGGVHYKHKWTSKTTASDAPPPEVLKQLGEDALKSEILKELKDMLPRTGG